MDEDAALLLKIKAFAGTKFDLRFKGSNAAANYRRLAAQIRRIAGQFDVEAQRADDEHATPQQPAPDAAPEASPSNAQPSNAQPSNTPAVKKKKHHKDHDFCFADYHTRYVAIEVLYFGQNYCGLAGQTNSVLPTIEYALFEALQKARIIPANATWQELRYSRCGRTDKGVSALSQVLALTLRSRAKRDQPLPDAVHEMDYCAAVNRYLPDDIRLLGWTDVDDNFNARFSCVYRHYKYFITDYRGELDIPAMRDAARRLVGRHDFRNMCKIDVEKMHNLERIIWHASITPHGHDSHIKPPPDACFIKRDLNAVWEEEGQAYIDHASVVVGMHEVSPHTGETTHNTGSHCAGKKHERDANACEKNNTDALPTQGDVVMTSAEGGGGRASNGEEGLPVPVGGTKQQQQQGQNTVYVVDIVGSAFLWHQVRCIVALLLMVGRHQEDPTIVDQLLDLTVFPSKPMFLMAHEQPLLLYHAGFKQLPFVRPAASTWGTLLTLEKRLAKLDVERSMLIEALAYLRKQPVTGTFTRPSGNHIPLKDRHREPSVDERKAAHAARQEQKKGEKQEGSEKEGPTKRARQVVAMVE